MAFLVVGVSEYAAACRARDVDFSIVDSNKTPAEVSAKTNRKGKKQRPMIAAAICVGASVVAEKLP